MIACAAPLEVPGEVERGAAASAAAAATIAPQPASTQPVVRRSPRKASHTAAAASASSGRATAPTTWAFAIAHAAAMSTPTMAVPAPSRTTVPRPSRESTNAPAAAATATSSAAIAMNRIPSATWTARSPALPRFAVRIVTAPESSTCSRQVGPDLLERGADDEPDVGERERERARVLLHERAVHVPHRGAEQPAERAAADDARDGGLDQRPRGDEVALLREHEVVGDVRGDRVPRPLVRNAALARFAN